MKNIKPYAVGIGTTLVGSAVLAVAVSGGGALGAFAPSITNAEQKSAAVMPVFQQFEGANVDYYDANTTKGDLMNTSTPQGTINNAQLPIFPDVMSPTHVGITEFKIANGDGTAAHPGEKGILSIKISDDLVNAEDLEALKLVEVKVDLDKDLDGVYETVGTTVNLKDFVTGTTPFVIDSDFVASEAVGVKIEATHIGDRAGAIPLNDQIGKEIKDLDVIWKLDVA